MPVPTGPLVDILCALSAAFATDLARAEAGEGLDVTHRIAGRTVELSSLPSLDMYEFRVRMDDHGLWLFGGRADDDYVEGAEMAPSNGHDPAAFIVTARAREKKGETHGDLLPDDVAFAPLRDLKIVGAVYDRDVMTGTTHWPIAA